MGKESTNRHLGPEEKNDPGPFRSQVGSLLLLAAIFFLNFMARILLAPLMPAMEKQLGLSHGEAGSLFLLISLGYFITLLGSGFISARLTHRSAIILSSVAVGLTLFGISLSSSLWGIRLGLFLLGGAAGVYLPSGIATLTSLIHSRHWGKAIAIHELAPNLGFVAAPLLSEALLIYFSWRGVLALIGAIALITGLAFARFGKGGAFRGQAPSLGSSKTLLADPGFWIMMFLFSLAISGSLGVYTMLPLYLVVERGIDRNWANTLIALSRISGLGMVFLGGWAADRLGAKQTMRVVFLLTGMATLLLGAAPNYWLVFLVFLQPMLAVCFFPAGFAALSFIGPPKIRNLTVSLTVPFAFILGGGIVPMGVGIMGDFGSFGLGIVLVGGLILSGTIISRYLALPASPGRVG